MKNLRDMNTFMRYKPTGEMVTVKPYSPDQFDSLQLDAKRIMGLEPAKQKVSVTVKNPFPIYLKPPFTGTDTWHYAQRILKLKWPVVSIWTGISYIVNLSDLEELPK